MMPRAGKWAWCGKDPHVPAYFELYENGKYIGRIKKKLTLFSPGFDIDFNGWQVDGNLLEWDYTIRDAQGRMGGHGEQRAVPFQ